MYLKSQSNATTGDLRLALLIDADNVSSQYLNALMNEVARYGNPTIKRIYGDWTRPSLNSWKGLLLNHAIHPVQQFGYTYGKNSTDSALIIDAMDLLYSGRCDAFALVSSDSDFTRLAMRLREAGMVVYGFGERKTPNAFTAACDRFIYLEVLTQTTKKSYVRKPTQEKQAEMSSFAPNELGSPPSEMLDLLEDSIRDLEDENGWAFLGAVGSLINKKLPSFDTRSYGFSKLVDLISSSERFEVRHVSNVSDTAKLVYVRVASKSSSRQTDLAMRPSTTLAKPDAPVLVPEIALEKSNAGDLKTTDSKSHLKDTKQEVKRLAINDALLTIIADSIEETVQANGWSNLSNACELLRKKKPDFDSKQYGYSKVSNFFESLKGIEIRISKTPGEPSSTVAVRCGEAMKRYATKVILPADKPHDDAEKDTVVHIPLITPVVEPEKKTADTKKTLKQNKTPKTLEIANASEKIQTEAETPKTKTAAKRKTTPKTKVSDDANEETSKTVAKVENSKPKRVTKRKTKANEAVDAPIAVAEKTSEDTKKISKRTTKAKTTETKTESDAPTKKTTTRKATAKTKTAKDATTKAEKPKKTTKASTSTKKSKTATE